MSFSALARRSGLTVEEVRSLFCALLLESRNRDSVRLRHFGTFYIRRRRPRVLRTAYSRKTKVIPGRVSLLFECSPDLVRVLSGQSTKTGRSEVLQIGREFRKRDLRDGRLPK